MLFRVFKFVLLITVLAVEASAQEPPYDVFPDATPPYYRVRYEDLVDQPYNELARVYSFMGLNFGKRESAFVFSHTHQQPSKNPYYSTFRGANFTHDTWKRTLNLEVNL